MLDYAEGILVGGGRQDHDEVIWIGLGSNDYAVGIWMGEKVMLLEVYVRITLAVITINEI